MATPGGLALSGPLCTSHPVAAVLGKAQLQVLQWHTSTTLKLSICAPLWGRLWPEGCVWGVDRVGGDWEGYQLRQKDKDVAYLNCSPSAPPSPFLFTDNQPESCSLLEKGVVSMANNRTTRRPHRKHRAWRITGSRVRLG